MIDQVLSFLALELNEFFRISDNRSLAIVSGIVGDEGEFTYEHKAGMEGMGLLLLTLINVEEEALSKSLDRYDKQAGAAIGARPPAEMINFYVMASSVSNGAEQDRYVNALATLSSSIGFFRGKSLFSYSTSPAMPAAVDKLMVDLVTLTFEQQHHIWQTLGVKYRPSVVYKIRTTMVVKPSWDMGASNASL